MDDHGPLINARSDIGINEVYQKVFGFLDYGVFHSKLILYEFDDILRVIVPSANLYQQDWKGKSNLK
jgi:hypothetical protein